MKRIGSYIKYKTKNATINIGTFNKKSCNTLYIKIGTWCSPIDSLVVTNDIIRRNIKANMYVNCINLISGYQTYLLNTNYNQTKSCDVSNKLSFFEIELTIFLNQKFEFDLKLINECKSLVDVILNRLEELSDNFSIQLSKNK